MNIEIYCNYGCLSAEKMNVYTYDAPEATAVSYDKLSVAIPDEWKTLHGEMGELLLEAPWGTRYEVSEVLYSMRRNGVDSPCFKAYDKNGRYHIQRLRVVSPSNEEMYSLSAPHVSEIRESCGAKQVAARHKQTAKKRGPKI